MEAKMSREYAKVIAKAWIDPSFKERLLQNPDAVLSEYGIILPEGMDFNNFVVPSAPVNMVRDMNLEIHTCPEEGVHEAVLSCPSPPIDLVHEQNFAIANCPAE